MNARKEALLALTDIVEEGAYSNIRLSEVRASEEDTAFICALVYAALEHLFWTDYMLAFYVKRQKKTVRNILRLAVTELFFMHTPAYAAVSEAVSLCKQTGKQASAGLVNAVLHKLLQEKDSLPALPEKPSERLSIEYSVPEVFVREWLAKYGQETVLSMLKRPAPVTEIRAQWPFSTDALLARFPKAARGREDDNCLLLPAGSLLPGDALIQEGKAVFQSEGAMAICRFTHAEKGERILDACAAPGGKSAYLWSLSEGEIDLVCLEVHAHRAELMKKTFARLHIHAEVNCRDASVFEPAWENAFDTVLLDVPCSGMGLIATKPDVGLNKEGSDLGPLTETQGKILETCCRYVRPGGKLVYATCTVSAKENEERVAAFLREHTEFTLEEQKQLLPNIHTSGGFYMARLRKACI